MVARHSILPTFCRFCWWQLEKLFSEQKGCDQGFRIPDSGFQILHSRFREGYCYSDLWISLAGQKIADLFVRLSTAFLSPEDSKLFVVWRFLNSTQVGDFWTLRNLETSELIAVWRLPNSTQVGDFRAHRSLETSELIADLRLPNFSQSRDFWTHRSLETSVLIVVWRFLNSTQFGGFWTHRSLETSELFAVRRLLYSSIWI